MKVRELGAWRSSTRFSTRERLVLSYAEAVTSSLMDVSDELFEQLGDEFSERELVVLTSWICLENFYSKFNRSFRIESQGFCVLSERPTE
jgi:alkylhydroperoxidase family enzyme